MFLGKKTPQSVISHYDQCCVDKNFGCSKSSVAAWNCAGKKKSTLSRGNSSTAHTESLSFIQCGKSVWLTWTHCKICVGKYFALKKNFRLSGFLLTWLDFAHENP